MGLTSSRSLALAVALLGCWTSHSGWMEPDEGGLSADGRPDIAGDAVTSDLGREDDGALPDGDPDAADAVEAGRESGADDTGAGSCSPALEVTLRAEDDCTDYEIPGDAPTTTIGCVGETGFLVVVHRPDPAPCCILTSAAAEAVCTAGFEAPSVPCICANPAEAGCSRTTGDPPASGRYYTSPTSTITYVLRLDGWDGSPVRLRICPYRAAWC
ncbi:MAG: hypothetical protein HY905_10200 [Deltaproteobacteria bacterium]|nr:hypothetical protein [Deltaproteobacteria bacterium]